MQEGTVKPAASCRLRTDTFGWRGAAERNASMKDQEKKRTRFGKAAKKEVD